MGTGYTRQDTGNNINNGTVADATVLDAEFDKLVSSFDATSGHTHDGTAANGGRITVIGPASDIIASGTSLLPKADNTYNLGSALYSWKDFYVDGTATLATLLSTTATLTAGTITTATVNGGTINNTSVGATTASTVRGTVITATTNFSGPITTAAATITGGTIDNTPVGATTASTVRGTVITATTNFSGPITTAAATITGGTIENTNIGTVTPAIVSSSDLIFTNALQGAVGSVSSPSYTWVGDLNTGMFHPAADVIAWATGGVEALRVNSSQLVLVGVGGFGWFAGVGNGGTVTQTGSRTTAVTLNTWNGQITLLNAAGSTTAATFTVNNTLVAAGDHITIHQKSGTNLYQCFITAVAAGSFNVTFFTTGGTASDSPVFSYEVHRGTTT